MKTQTFGYWRGAMTVLSVVLGFTSLSPLSAQVLVLDSLETRSEPASVAQTTTRPISDFLEAQGKYCWDDGHGGCLLFVPPVVNFTGFADVLCTSRTFVLD